MRSNILILLTLLSGPILEVYGQCGNSDENPVGGVIVSTYSDTVIVTTEQHAGQFFVAQGFQAGDSYVVVSSSSGDYFTVLDADDPSIVIAEGATPLSFSSAQTSVIIEVNLASPPCGTDTLDRTTYLVCTSCPAPPPPPAPPPAVGVGVTEPEAFLDVAGEIRLGDVQWPPQAGMIRWNTDKEDFEGYDGAIWRSLTRTNGIWGRLPSHEVNESSSSKAVDGSAEDLFGVSVSISSDYAIIGAYHDDIGANANQGSVYIYKRTGTAWIQEVKLTASDGAAFDDFGSSVAISGDYAIVGASQDDIGGNVNQGSAYVFKRSGASWIEEAKLTASDGAGGDVFGNSVAIYGDYVIVGAVWDDIGANTDQGSAYVFKRTGTSWAQETKLTAFNGAAYDYFGKAVSISGDYAIVGASDDDFIANVDQGTAYVFKRSGAAWVYEWYFGALDGAAGDNFGWSVSLSGDYAAIGAPFKTVGSNTTQGSAYVFKRNGTYWEQEAKLTALDGAALDNFGWSVSISGDYVIIGAADDSVGDNTYQGSAYLFKRVGTNWPQEVKMTASDGVAFESFGRCVSISGDYVVVGVPFDDVGGNSNQGSVYFYNRIE